MKNLLWNRIPSTCICFTLIVLANWGLNLLWGNEVSSFPLILFVWIAACQLIDALISRIEFRKWSHYCIAESVVFYLLSLFISRMFFWKGMDKCTFIKYMPIIKLP